jgi:hypothetical protein
MGCHFSKPSASGGTHDMRKSTCHASDDTPEFDLDAGRWNNESPPDLSATVAPQETPGALSGPDSPAGPTRQSVRLVVRFAKLPTFAELMSDSGSGSGSGSDDVSSAGFGANLQPDSARSGAPNLQSALRSDTSGRHKQRWVAGSGGLPPRPTPVRRVRVPLTAVVAAERRVEGNSADNAMCKQNLLATWPPSDK